MTSININLVPDMVKLKYICKVLLSMRYLSKNGGFNTLKIPCLINADHYIPQKSVIEASRCINSPFFCCWVSTIPAANSFLSSLIFVVAYDEWQMLHNLLFLVDILMN